MTRDDMEEMEWLKEIFRSEFEIKNLWQLRYFLGIEVARSTEQIYTLDLLKETGILGCKVAKTPIDLNMKFGRTKDEIPIDRVRY